MKNWPMPYRRGLRHLFGEEAMRYLHENAAAVAELGICPDRAAVVEIDEDLQALGDDRVRPAVRHVGDEADAAGIMLVARIVEALCRRQGRIDRFDGRSGSGARLVRGASAPI
jgi:hypothetical protein